MTAALLGKARQALETAGQVLALGDASAAINRAYYAAFYAALAALSSVGEAPKTHTGVHQRFWVRFVQTGRFSAAVARTLPDSFAARLSADYDALLVTDEAAARDLLADVTTFLEAVEALLASG